MNLMVRDSSKVLPHIGSPGPATELGLSDDIARTLEYWNAPNGEGLIADLERISHDHARSTAAEAVRELVERLDGTSVGRALRRVTLGADKSLRDDAAEVGVSQVAIWKAQRVIRRRLDLEG